MNTNPNDMPIDFNDDEAKLTAYVLGELGPDDVVALEASMAVDAKLRQEVDAIRGTVGQLTDAFAAEASPGLTPDQRAVISAGSAIADEPPVIFSFRRWAGVGLAAAACLAIVALVPVVLPGPESVEVAATLDPNTAPNTRLAEADFGADEADVRFRKAVDTDGLVRQEQASAPGPAAYGGVAGGERELHDMMLKSSPALTTGSAADDGRASGASGRAGGSAPAESAYRKAGEMRQPPGSVGATPGAADAPGFGIAGASRARRAPATASTPAPVRTQTAASRPPAPLAQVRGALLEVPIVEGDQQGAGFGGGGLDREAYGSLVDNPFRSPVDTPLSTFSIDVDTASYSNVRRMLRQGQRVPADAVRIEEFINYFDYAYEPPSGDEPFSVNVETGSCPWEPDHRLVRIGLRGQDVDLEMRPATSLVFLIDVSGSMNQANKMPLLKESLGLLVDRLNADDRIAMVVYAGAAGVVLPPTYCDEKQTILGALDRLSAGGSTNGGAGIELAYNLATEHFIEGGVNRVILCTDGDFNVGVSSQGDLDRLIEAKRETGVFLSVLGFGHGNWQDDRMETLSNKGNGNFAYIDSLREAKKVLVREMGGTLVTIAKDVKVQVEFNPSQVAAYRLIGYANRILAAEDFNDDTKDAGEIGAGHTVTALYEIVPPGAPMAARSVDPLKYQKPSDATVASDSNEMMTVKLRYKAPDGDVSKLIEEPVVDGDAALAQTTSDFRFAAAIAEFGMLLRGSEHRAGATWEQVLDLSSPGLVDDPHGDRAEFIDLVRRAQSTQQSTQQ